MRICWLPLLLLLAAPLAADTTLLYDFEGGTQGFNGKTSTSPIGATSGKMALEIDTTGMTGWQQDLATLSQNEDWTDAVEFQADVFLPAGTKAAAEYVQLIPTFSGPLDSFYQIGKAELQDGHNEVRLHVNGAKVTTPWKLYLIVNSGKAMPGKIYVDNIRMRKPGKPGSLTVTIKDPAGAPVAGAVVAAGTGSAVSDAQGRAVLNVPSDTYDAEVLGADILPAQFKAVVTAGSSQMALTVKRPPAVAPRALRAWVQGGKAVTAFDAHKIYGHNMAMWSGADPFTNEVQLKKLRDARVEMIRIPGGEYGNRWNWQTGSIYKQDQGMAVDWTPEANWGVWKKFFASMGPQTEALMILNVFQSTPDDQVAWIKDARDAGIKVRYIELGNEPDLDPTRFFGGVVGGSTYIDNYVKTCLPFAQAVRKALFAE